MKSMDRSQVMALLAITGLLGAMALIGGCTTRRLSVDSRLPDQPQLVGGGMMIAWKAPAPGTVYLVEKQTGKIVETRSLEVGEVYSFAATSVVQADEFEQMLGIRFARAQFLLYFEPAGGADGSVTVTSKPLRTGSRS
jgi:hypothetical protein